MSAWGTVCVSIWLLVIGIGALRAASIDNGRVRVVVTERDGVVVQEYFARRGAEWKLVLRAFNPPVERAGQPLTLFSSGPEVVREHRYLTTEVLREIAVEGADIVLSGVSGGTRIRQVIRLAGNESRIHVVVTARLASSPPRLEYLWSPFVFAEPGKPDFTHAPTLKRAADNLIGDRIFYAPAVIVQKGALFAALVPDLELINSAVVFAKDARPIQHPRIFAVPVDPEKVSMPTAMDLELQSPLTPLPLLGYGMVDFVGEQHVFWRHENKGGQQVRTLSASEVRYGFDLMLSASASPSLGYQKVSRYLWEHYGAWWFRKPRPQAQPFSEYARICYPAAFAYKGFRIARHDGEQEVEHHAPPGYDELETWREWTSQGEVLGGYRNSAPQWYSLIGNTPWWNNARDAAGAWYWGERLSDSSLVEKARRMVGFSLSAPQDGGVFPGLYDVKTATWLASHWKPPREGYDPGKTERYFHPSSDIYQTAAMSVTAAYLLRYYNTCEKDPRILRFVQNYADFLVQNIGRDGVVPAWFGPDRQPLQSLRWNSEGGAHIWLLADLYRLVKEERYLQGARRIADALRAEVLPGQKWHDVEAFYSCAVKPETFFEPRTGQPARSTLSMPWAIHGFASLYELTQDATYLRAGEAVADYAGFFQAVWAPHFVITAYPFGGWSSQIGDAEWLDGRQCEFARAMTRLGLVAGRQDLLERGVAAARASLVLTNQPRHVENDIYRYPHYPFGLGPENIDHEGFPQKPHRSSAGWNEVSGLAAVADVLRMLGGVFIDARRNLAVGVDGVSVRSFRRSGRTLRLELDNLLAHLPRPFESPYRIELRVTGLSEGRYHLVVNGRERGAATDRELSAFPLEIGPR